METLKGIRGTAAALLLVLSLGAVPAWGAAAGSPSPVELWKYSTFGSINDIAVNPNATLIAGVGGDGRLYLLNNTSKLLGAALLGPEMFRVAMSPDGGTMAVVERSPDIRAHGADLREAWRFRARSIATAVAAFSGGFAVGDDGGRVTFLDGAGTYRAEAVTAGPIRGLAATPSGERVAALSGDGNLYLLDGRGRVVRKSPTEDAQALGLSPEGDMLAVGTKAGVLRVLDAEGSLRWEYKTPGPVVRSAASRGGRLVVAATATQIVALDGRGNFLWKYEDPIGILSVTVAEDGSRVAYGGRDTHIHWLSSGLAPLEPSPAASPAPSPVQSPSPTPAATPSPPSPSPTPTLASPRASPGTPAGVRAPQIPSQGIGFAVPFWWPVLLVPAGAAGVWALRRAGVLHLPASLPKARARPRKPLKVEPRVAEPPRFDRLLQEAQESSRSARDARRRVEEEVLRRLEGELATGALGRERFRRLRRARVERVREMEREQSEEYREQLGVARREAEERRRAEFLERLESYRKSGAISEESYQRLRKKVEEKS